MTDQPPPLPPGQQPPDPGPPPRDPAVLHVTEQTRTYPCPNCGGTLVYDPEPAALKCIHCGTVVAVTPDVAQPARIGKRELASTMAQLARLQANAKTRVSGDKEVVCQNCGGHTMFTGTFTAVRCPFCNTPIQRSDVQDAPTRLPIDGVLPLRINEKDARVRIEQWINSRRFAPNAFKKYRELGSFSSIYLPYFSYDAATTTRYTGMRGIYRTETYRDSEGRTQTRTVTDWYPAAGVVNNQFEDVTGHASDGLDDQKITELEPWPMDWSHQYSPQFVAGHLSRTYDWDASQVFERFVEPRMESVIDATIRADIGGNVQQIHSRDINWLMVRFCQLALPVWMLTVTYKQKPFQVVINGVTGEVQGRRPWSAVKITFAVIVGLLLVLLVVWLVQTYGGEA
ncbi:MAG: hypothetical protein WBL05_01060 [Brooklawnia sp.]|uniref:hypothetical protein n=1 Tax=Brooklawnia sp. TaxID=2699740 RepID=UPI003C7125DC